MAGPPDLTRARDNVRERVLVDEARAVERTTDDPVFDPIAGKYTLPEDATVWSGPFAVIPAAQERVAVDDQGAVYQAPNRAYDGYAPWDTTAIEPGMVVEMTAIHEGGDPALLGRQFLVVDDITSTIDVLRRLRLQELREGDARYRSPA